MIMMYDFPFIDNPQVKAKIMKILKRIENKHGKLRLISAKKGKGYGPGVVYYYYYSAINDRHLTIRLAICYSGDICAYYVIYYKNREIMMSRAFPIA